MLLTSPQFPCPSDSRDAIFDSGSLRAKKNNTSLLQDMWAQPQFQCEKGEHSVGSDRSVDIPLPILSDLAGTHHLVAVTF